MAEHSQGRRALRVSCCFSIVVLASGCGLLPHRIDSRPPDESAQVVPLAPEGQPAPRVSGAADRSTSPALTGATAIADETRTDPCGQNAPAATSMVDDTREFIEETTCAASLWLDSLFGEQRHVAAARGTYGQLEAGAGYSQFDGFSTRVRFRVRVDLPNLKERVSAFLGRDNEEDFVQDRSEALALRTQFPRVDDNDQWLAGLGYSLPDSERFQTDFRVGVHNILHPRAFVQARVHYNVWSDRVNLVYARATPFWNSRDGFGITTGFEYNRALSDSLLLRQANVATISQESIGVDWLSSLALYQNLREQRAIGYEVFVVGQTRADEPLHEYGVRLIYRHPLVRDRLYVRLIPGYSFPRFDPALERKGSYSTYVNFELPFGQGEHANGR